jgi:nucleoside-diphosphate-sugar epimerase
VDFTYIDDLLEGLCLVMQKPEAINQIFNLTYGQSRSIRELLGQILKEFPQARVEHIQRDGLRPYRGTLSIQKARDLLGYGPRVPIEVGMERYIQWYRGLA